MTLHPMLHMNRILRTTAAIAALTLATAAEAQQPIPPASPTIGASAGFGAGIVAPIGALSDNHAAGYMLSGLVDFSAAEQPFSFRGEIILQHFDRKRSAAPEVESMNMVSFGLSLLARTPKAASSAFLLGGIGIYNATGNGTKPGINAGAGIEVPLTFFIGMADVRMHCALTEGGPLLTIPVTIGARF